VLVANVTTIVFTSPDAELQLLSDLMQDALVAAKKEMHNMQLRHDKQRAVRVELEMHLKELYKDYIAIKQRSAVQMEDLARLIADNKRFCGTHDQHAERVNLLQRQLQEKQELLLVAKVRLRLLHTPQHCTHSEHTRGTS
jgi:hypothetical protein